MDKAALRAVLAWAADRYEECLGRAPEAEAARRYLASRGLTPETIRRFRLGIEKADNVKVKRILLATILATAGVP